MTRFALIFVALTGASPALAQDMAETCGYQAEVVAAIQQARLDRVSERNVPAHIEAQDPQWPDQYDNAIPLITPWVYEQTRKTLRNENLAAAWTELCLQQ